MELSEIIGWVLGGGLVATTVAIVTLRSTVKEATAKAEKAIADAETVRIDNTGKATKILIENIVEPLREELNATRKDLLATKREMARLRKTIDTANSCKYHDDCPVLFGMRELAKSTGRSSNSERYDERRQQHSRSKSSSDGEDSDGGSEIGIADGEPP